MAQPYNLPSDSGIATGPYESQGAALLSEVWHSTTEAWQWTKDNVVKPAYNTVAVQPVNTISSLVNGASHELGGKSVLPELTAESVPVASSFSAAWWAQNISSGLAASFVYAAAGKAAGSVMRSAGRAMRLEGAVARIAADESLAQIAGAAAYDGLRVPGQNETRLGNMAGGAIGFYLLGKGQGISEQLGMGAKLLTRVGTGAVSATVQLATADLISRHKLSDGQNYLDAALSGSAMNLALPTVQEHLSKGIDHFNIALGHGIPLSRYVTREGLSGSSARLDFLIKDNALVRVQPSDEENKIDHKRDIIYLKGKEPGKLGHELTHRSNYKEHEGQFQQAGELLKGGQEEAAWEVYKKTRLMQEMEAREIEHDIGQEISSAPDVMKSKTAIVQMPESQAAVYEEQWRKEFKQFQETEGKYRPEVDYDVEEKYGRSIKYDAATRSAYIGYCGITDEELQQFLQRHPDLQQLGVYNCLELTSLPLEKLSNLQHLRVEYCDNLTSLPLEKLSNLQQLTVYSCAYLTSLPLESLSNLQQLKVEYCDNLTSLPSESLSNLQQLQVRSCSNLTSLPLEKLHNLQQLTVEYCPKLTSLPLEKLSNLQQLNVEYCPKLTSLPLEKLSNLQQLRVNDCRNLTSLPLENLSNLQHLRVKYYPNFAGLLTLPGSIRRVDIDLTDYPSNRTIPHFLPEYALDKAGQLTMSQKMAARIAWSKAVDATAGQVNEDRTSSFAAKDERINWLKGQLEVHKHLQDACLCPEDKQAVVESFHKLFESEKTRPATDVLKEGGSLYATISTLHGQTLSQHEQGLLQRAIENATNVDGVDSLSRWNNQFALACGFKARAFKEALNYITYPNDCTPGIADENSAADKAMRLSLTFGKQWRNWLEARGKAADPEGPNFLHDASYWLPAESSRALAGLDKYLFKYSQSQTTSLEMVAKHWSSLSEEERSLKLDELLKVVRQRVYPGVKNLEFAQEAAKWGTKDDSYRTYEARFLGSLDVSSPFPQDKAWEDKASGLTGRFLPRNDVRGLFLGQHTNCCQHPDGVGSACAWYGQESPRSGFFVVEDKRGNVVAQSWAWISDNGGLCFDNVEAKGLGEKNNSVASIYKSAAKDLSNTFHTVTLGTGSSDLEIPATWANAADRQLSLPHDYSGYADSDEQVILAHNTSIKPSVVEFGQSWVRGASEADREAVEKIAQRVYPQGWQVAPEDFDYGLILMDKEQGPVGYAAIETGEHYIADLAVLPEYTKRSMTLFNQLAKYIKRVGGEWTADCRESTSYRLLQAYAKRGRIEIIGDEVTGDMSGEPMHSVKFKIKESTQPVDS